MADKGKIFVTCVLALVFFLSTTTAFAGESEVKDDFDEEFETKIAVMDFGIFKDTKGKLQNEPNASYLSDCLMSEIKEREILFKLMDLELTHYDLDKETITYTTPISFDAAVKNGKKLGVKYIVHRIFKDKQNYTPMFELAKNGDKYTIKTSVHVGVWNLETNEEEKIFNYEGNITIDESVLINNYVKNRKVSWETEGSADYSEYLVETICYDFIYHISEEIGHSLLFLGWEEIGASTADEAIFEDGDLYVDTYKAD